MIRWTGDERLNIPAFVRTPAYRPPRRRLWPAVLAAFGMAAMGVFGYWLGSADCALLRGGL